MDRLTSMINIVRQKLTDAEYEGFLGAAESIGTEVVEAMQRMRDQEDKLREVMLRQHRESVARGWQPAPVANNNNNNNNNN
jgi:hypothetical protein